MKLIQNIYFLLILLIASCQNVSGDNDSNNNKTVDTGQEISFITDDQIEIIGDLYEQDKTAPTILLFHQGGSNARGEYGPIIPKLLEKGYNILATDQRSGGQYYGSYNRTLYNIPSHNYNDGYSYCDAFNNLEGALDFVISKGFTGDKILWGSSYSATLAIQLAEKRQSDITGVLAFSPASGGPMKDCLPEPYLETVKIPLLILKPPNEMESESSKAQFELARRYNHQTYAATAGVHGSSMLVEERVRQNVDDNWDVVLSFLDEIIED